MDYEKKYKEALERAKEYLEEYDFEEAVKEIFPELKESKESKDERIRKALINVFATHKDYEMFFGVSVEDIRAWLEKQGEIDKSSYEVAENEKREFVGDGFIKCYADFQDFKEGERYWLEYVGNDNCNVRSDNLLGKTYHITPCQLYTIFKKMTRLEKQSEQKVNYTTLVETGDGGINTLVTGELPTNGCDDEQKSTWSEEDERLCSCLIKDQENALDDVRNDKYGHSEIISDLKEMYRERIDWLKSLRIKPHWKPSDEQIKILNEILNFAVNHENPYWNDYIFGTLNNLIRQLKKLREE